jgi:hypothetical protein
MPDLGRYSHRFRFDVGEPTNESIAESDAFYTLNVLLGLSRLPTLDGCEYVDIRETYARCCGELRAPAVRAYRLGMALWSGAVLEIEPPGPVIDRVSAILTNPSSLARLTAQDTGMLLSGVTALALKADRQWRSAAERLADHLRQDYADHSSGLFYNQASGYRRRFSSFASQVYSILALYQFGEAFACDWAVDVANRAVARVISLQGPRGEWAWFYYVPRGRIVDFYEIYSVHQHGMAPAFLHHAVTYGVAGAREALVKGFLWLFGNNEMSNSMLRPAEHMFYRSQLRVGEVHSAKLRVYRSLVNAARGHSDTPASHRGLTLRQECRSYELGWILWSFAGRTDYPELTDRSELAV